MKTWHGTQRPRFDIETVYTDYEKMLARDDIDVIDVCTRGGIGEKNNHEPLAFAALQRASIASAKSRWRTIIAAPGAPMKSPSPKG